MSKFTRVTKGKFVRVAQVDYRTESDEAGELLLQKIQEATKYARNPNNEVKTDENGPVAPAPYLNKIYQQLRADVSNYAGLPIFKSLTKGLSLLAHQMDYIGNPVPAKTPSAPVAAPGAQTASAPTSIVGQSPVDQAAPTSSSAPVAVQTSVAPATTVAPAVAKPNYFALADLDPNGKGYVGNAEQNEKLRRAIDSAQKTQSRTFYDAYSKAFGGWNQHPSNRIDNLIGKTAPTQGPPAPEKVAPTQGPPAPKQTATPTIPTPAAQSVAANPSTPPSPSYGGGYSPSRIP